MKIQTKPLAIAIIHMLFPCFLAGHGSGTAQGMPIDYRYIDPLDTLDEEDVLAMRDTTQLTRINRAKDTKTINALDYILKDRYSPYHHSFDNYWYDHIYIGGSLGVEQINPQSDAYKFRTISQLSLLVGKQLDRANSIRLALGGGWGYQREKNLWLKRAMLRLDYLYNLSTFFSGYNPARRVEASLLFGIGANYAWTDKSDKLFAPEAHFGVQVKCYTGPLGTMNLEPYIGVASDRIDVSGTRNWRGYDIIYGLNVNYSFYLVDNLSKEARHTLLESRLADDRLVDPETLEKWRTPWFLEFAMGPVMSHSSELDFSKTLGNQTTLSLGRWLSPAIGFRLSAITRSTKWQRYDVAETRTTAAYTKNYNSHYVSGRLEALLNPFGFLNSFRWQAPWGAYLVFGGEMGTLTKYMPYSRLRTKSESYDVGAHFWYAISEDMQAFIEPRFTRNVYTIPYTNVHMRQMHGDNNLGLDIGLTMLIRSAKFRMPEEMDHTQKFLYRNIRGVRIGIAGGLPVYQRRGDYYDGGKASWSGMAFMEYRFNGLHTVRLQAECLTTGHGALTTYQDEYTDPSAGEQSLRREGIWHFDHRLLLGSLNYELSLTNICGGRLMQRNFELEAFLGPAMGYVMNSKAAISPDEPMAEADGGHTLTLPQDDAKKTMFGANLGLKLSAYLGKGFSVSLTPTTYLLHSKQQVPGLYTERLGAFHLYQTVNLGLQYKVGKLRRNPTVMRRIHRERDHNWNSRQLEKMRRAQEKLEEKHARRRANPPRK